MRRKSDISRMRNKLASCGDLRKRTNHVAKELQKLVRLRAADENGICQCVTCGKRKHWKDMQGGHCIHGRNSGTVLDERNVHPQCVTCNDRKSGNQGEYYDFMRAKYGPDIIDELKRLDKEGYDWTVEELLELKIKWMDEIEELERSLA